MEPKSIQEILNHSKLRSSYMSDGAFPAAIVSFGVTSPPNTSSPDNSDIAEMEVEDGKVAVNKEDAPGKWNSSFYWQIKTLPDYFLIFRRRRRNKRWCRLCFFRRRKSFGFPSSFDLWSKGKFSCILLFPHIPYHYSLMVYWQRTLWYLSLLLLSWHWFSLNISSS